MNEVRHRYAARLTGNDQSQGPTVVNHGGFSVASSIGVAVSAAFTIAVIMSLSYSAYYRHAKLKLHRQFLDRLSQSTFRNQDRGAEVSREAAMPGVLCRTRTAADTYGLAVLMSSSCQMSPAVYSALQEAEPQPPTAPAEAKVKAATENKVLGRREDFIPLGRQFARAAVDGQMLTLSRPPL